MQFRTRLRRNLVILVFVALSVAVPSFVFASHQFTDVPDGGFHGDITRLAGAGITGGCTATTFCPTQAVSRGQMAAFLNRTGGRAAYDTNGFTADISTIKSLADVTIRAGNLTGGTAFIQLEASLYGFETTANTAGCVPCTAQYQIIRDAGGSSNFTVTASHNLSTTEIEADAGSISWVVAVPTGVNQVFHLTALQIQGTGSMTAVGSLVATYVPFGPTGGNTLTGAGSPTVDSGGPFGN